MGIISGLGVDLPGRGDWLGEGDYTAKREGGCLEEKAGILVTAMILLMLGVVKNNLLVRQSQGRFLFPALGAIAVLLSYGFLNLFPDRVRDRAAVGYTTVLITLNLVSLFAYLIPESY